MFLTTYSTLSEHFQALEHRRFPPADVFFAADEDQNNNNKKMSSLLNFVAFSPPLRLEIGTTVSLRVADAFGPRVQHWTGTVDAHGVVGIWSAAAQNCIKTWASSSAAAAIPPSSSSSTLHQIHAITCQRRSNCLFEVTVSSSSHPQLKQQQQSAEFSPPPVSTLVKNSSSPSRPPPPSYKDIALLARNINTTTVDGDNNHHHHSSPPLPPPPLFVSDILQLCQTTPHQQRLVQQFYGDAARVGVVPNSIASHWDAAGGAVKISAFFAPTAREVLLARTTALKKQTLEPLHVHLEWQVDNRRAQLERGQRLTLADFVAAVKGNKCHKQEQQQQNKNNSSEPTSATHSSSSNKPSPSASASAGGSTTPSALSSPTASAGKHYSNNALYAAHASSSAANSSRASSGDRVDYLLEEVADPDDEGGIPFPFGKIKISAVVLLCGEEEQEVALNEVAIPHDGLKSRGRISVVFRKLRVPAGEGAVKCFRARVVVADEFKHLVHELVSSIAF